MSEPVPPIGTQISALAALAPDEPAVTCDGLTITRAELDRRRTGWPAPTPIAVSASAIT